VQTKRRLEFAVTFVGFFEPGAENITEDMQISAAYGNIAQT
jgi:hypothetical protein